MIRAAVIALIVCVAGPAAAQDYRFPGADDHRQHFYITAYRDLSGSGNGLKDWGCGSKTYDGHRGTDMGVGSFPGMDAGRDVVSAADGVVTYVNDGAYDRCTTGNCAGGGGFGNYVRIEHADGKVTYYAHLKKFSITVAVGDSVTCGQTIGQVGSSGNSTGPHLHFEPRSGGTSDDPFSGPCGGPTSWWVEQGDYLGLPQTTCENQPPAHPLLTMDSELVPIDGQEPDLHPGGDSAGIFDLEPGQSVTARFWVTDDPTAVKSPNVVVGVASLGGHVAIRDWIILDDYPDNACGGALCPNDANDNPANPPADDPGDSFELHLNALSPGESKVVELTLEHATPTDGAAPHARVQLWVKSVEGSYEKDGFDSQPNNVDGSQTFNGGDLRQELVLDTWSESGGIDPTDPTDPTDPIEPGPPDAEGGCAASGGGAGGAAILLLGLVARLRRRRESE